MTPASLLFVGVQLRQGNKIARAQMTAAVSDKITSLMQTASTDGGLAAAFGAVVLSDGRARDEGFPKLMFWFNGWLHVFHSAWVGIRDGLIDERMLEMIEVNVFWYTTKPAMDRGWQNSKHAFPRDFVACVEARRSHYSERVGQMFQAELQHIAQRHRPQQSSSK